MNRPKILVIDDELDHVTILVASLELEGFDAFAASNGEEALEKIRTTVPDLIILDLFMPGLDGEAFLNVLKSDGRLNRIPVIIYTAAKTTRKDREEGLARGAQEYLFKGVPDVGPPEVVDAVARILAQKPPHSS